MFDDIPLAPRENIIFQHDGAPAHNAHIVRDYLNGQFPNRWLGTYGPIEWPPRSPDILLKEKKGSLKNNSVWQRSYKSSRFKR
ncbi:Hypothetical protein CINCED_3A009578 [Cinara cedri]|uniref:Tc1-like transposase DDE domain-containing protein n=1 Tax=Cinara cedri TaxID=506608 RepID=A0A5E4MKZ4_9HEMI|nr:Hypothetical protein CINCED_3A009578 [Cinara cedri]